MQGTVGRMDEKSLIPIERIARQIYLIRGQKVMLDFDLAALYGVETRTLNQAVTRNRPRFPEDFMFRLSWEEYQVLRSQIVILENSGRGRHKKYTPRAFTQEGVAMLSGVLRSKRAVEVNIAIMRTFVRLRQILGNNEKIANKVAQHDQQIAELMTYVKALLEPPDPGERNAVGFQVPREDD